MNPSYCKSHGEPPRYVRWIEHQRMGAVIHLSGGGEPINSHIACASDNELRSQCHRLASQRVLFSVGDFAGQGPAEMMARWQEEGLMPLSFLQISWQNPNEWLVYEMLPGARQWEFSGLDRMPASSLMQVVNDARNEVPEAEQP